MPFSPLHTTRAWRIAFLVCCTVGVLLCADLLRLHARVHTDPDYHSYCAVTEYMDCDEVALSDYAVLGGLPVALWGMLGYIFMGGLSIWGLGQGVKPESWPFGLLFGLSVFAIAVSLVMFYISHYVIKSLCLVCTATYIVNLLLLGAAFGELRQRRTGPFSALKQELGVFAAKWRALSGYALSFVAAAAVLWLLMPTYWLTEAATGPGGLPVGQTPQGAHWIGARKPALEIVEFSDYQCPYCQRSHVEVRAIVEMAPDRIRLVHRHYPLRRHSEALNYAVMAHCAGRQNRFWDANDYLFANGRRNDPVTPEELAAALGIDPNDLSACLGEAAARQVVADDVQAGHTFNIQGTPTFIIDGKQYPGRIPQSVFEPLLAE